MLCPGSRIGIISILCFPGPIPIQDFAFDLVVKDEVLNSASFLPSTMTLILPIFFPVMYLRVKASPLVEILNFVCGLDVEMNLPPEALLFFFRTQPELLDISFALCQVKSPFLLGIFLIVLPEASIAIGISTGATVLATAELVPDDDEEVVTTTSVALSVAVGVGVGDGEEVSEIVGEGVGVGLGATTFTSPLRNVGTGISVLSDPSS